MRIRWVTVVTAVALLSPAVVAEGPDLPLGTFPLDSIAIVTENQNGGRVEFHGDGRVVSVEPDGYEHQRCCLTDKDFLSILDGLFIARFLYRSDSTYPHPTIETDPENRLVTIAEPPEGQEPQRLTVKIGAVEKTIVVWPNESPELGYVVQSMKQKHWELVRDE